MPGSFNTGPFFAGSCGAGAGAGRGGAGRAGAGAGCGAGCGGGCGAECSITGAAGAIGATGATGSAGAAGCGPSGCFASGEREALEEADVCCDVGDCSRRFTNSGLRDIGCGKCAGCHDCTSCEAVRVTGSSCAQALKHTPTSPSINPTSSGYRWRWVGEEGMDGTSTIIAKPPKYFLQLNCESNLRKSKLHHSNYSNFCMAAKYVQ